jgi:hypothetical protein
MSQHPLPAVRCHCDSLKGAQRFTAYAQVVQSSQPVQFNCFLCCAWVIGCGVYDIAVMMSM